jgi:hypothetical protein
MDNEPKLKIDKNGTKRWRLLNGERHRIDGPAIEFVDGTKYWYLHDQIHRVDGPAFERQNSHKEWWLNNQLHRVDGPAIERVNGSKDWWLNSKNYSFDEWLEANTYISEEEKLMLKLQYG